MKTRGLKEAEIRIGDIGKEIERLLKTKKKIRIFESGCGYGRLMIDLSIKYGKKVEVIGMNLKKGHGEKKIMIGNAIKNKVIDKKDLKNIKLPKIIYGDAGERIPFKTGSIDLVLSQVSVYLYQDKMNFFREVGRVLTKEGVGLITYPGNKKIPKEFQPLLKIYKNGKLITFEEYIKKFRRINLFKNKQGGISIKIKKSDFNFDVKLEASINLNHINKKWFGVQSIYTRK